MARASVYPERHLLFVATAAIEQLDGKGNHPDHFGLARFEQESCLSWPAGHKRVTVTIENVNKQRVYHPFGRMVLFANVG